MDFIYDMDALYYLEDSNWENRFMENVSSFNKLEIKLNEENKKKVEIFTERTMRINIFTNEEDNKKYNMLALFNEVIIQQESNALDNEQ